ncbi:MAG TPA: LemA family protein [Bacteroidia bacterium]|nr:LemA family protein [Bacteroidia bacterium]
MKKYIIWGVIALLIIYLISLYNGLVGMRESVNASWANVESQYQRRADLVPNLVSTVQGAADFEKSTLQAVVDARARATSIQIDPNKLTPEKLQEFQQAQGALSTAIGRLLAVAENYPQLKAVDAFRDLQAQLEGTENRINEARRQFNEAAKSYNAGLLKFPRVIFAKLFSFESRAYFEADKGTEEAPKVQF